MEWKLFEDVPPEAPEAIAGRGWMDLAGQPGFTQRAKMVTDLASLVFALRPDLRTATELGCGDGSLLAMLECCAMRAWGYELGAADVAHGKSQGLDVRQADILTASLDYGDVLVASEVLEHLADPVAFLRGLPSRLLICSSPSAETGDWHNPIHAWAWDLEGYRHLLSAGGWRVLHQAECYGGLNEFGGVPGDQRFQAIVAAR